MFILGLTAGGVFCFYFLFWRPTRWSRAPITIISDCRDDNARGRMLTRLASYLPAHITFIGVANETEAAVCLVDTLDALEDRLGTIILNVARRNGQAKRWYNGTPFCELMVNNARIFATFDGRPLRFLAGILDQPLAVKVYDLGEVVTRMRLTKIVQDRIVDSQFRSFDFETRLVVARLKGWCFPFYTEVVERGVVGRPIIGWVDNFGNCKTTALLGDLFIPEGKFYPRLKDVPDGELALVVGSSGIGEYRFLEFVVQGGSAWEKLGRPQVGEEVNL